MFKSTLLTVSSTNKRLTVNIMSLLGAEPEPISKPPPKAQVPEGVWLRKQRIRLDHFDGSFVDVDTTIQDSMPHGPNIGTVVCTPGSPGSHKDFKYILPHLTNHRIRMIGINFPGNEFTPSNDKLLFTNEERIQFVQKIVDRLDINGNMIFMGHSRGSENALKMAALNEDRCDGVVLVNPMGLKTHQGIRPTWIIAFFSWIWDHLSVLRFLLRPLYYAIYRLLKIRVQSGDEAAACIKTISTVDLESQMHYIKMINKTDQKMLIAYAGRDRFIESDISHHFVSLFKDMHCMSCTSLDTTPAVSEDVVKRFASGERRIAVYFEKETHFLQKYQSKFLADAVHAMLNASRSESEK